MCGATRLQVREHAIGDPPSIIFGDIVFAITPNVDLELCELTQHVGAYSPDHADRVVAQHIDKETNLLAGHATFGSDVSKRKAAFGRIGGEKKILPSGRVVLHIRAGGVSHCRTTLLEVLSSRPKVNQARHRMRQAQRRSADSGSHRLVEGPFSGQCPHHAAGDNRQTNQ